MLVIGDNVSGKGGKLRIIIYPPEENVGIQKIHKVYFMPKDVAISSGRVLKSLPILILPFRLPGWRCWMKLTKTRLSFLLI